MSDAMPPMNFSPDADRLFALLADRATDSLTAAEQAELDSLLRRVPPISDPSGRAITPESVESTAGALMFALGAKSGPMPSDARERLLTRGRQVVRELGGSPTLKLGTPAAPASKTGLLPYLGWLAAAAAVTLAAIVYFQRQPDPAWTRYAHLINNFASSTMRVAIAEPKPTEKPLAGEIVWNGERQEGYLRIRNLAPNDPKKEQYQLWIFDGGADAAKYPIDGGVFDVSQAVIDPASGDAVIPINAKLPVLGKPSLFALTIEQPGGVVVTDRTRLIAIAPVK